MKVAIAYYADKNREFIKYVKELEKGLKSQGHETVLFDLLKSSAHLSAYKFIVFGVNTTSFFGGKIPENFIHKIKNSGLIHGKHSAAFVDKKTGAFKTLVNLMNKLEQEGIIICSSEIIDKPEKAFQMGKKLIIE